MFQPVSLPLQKGIRFVPVPYPPRQVPYPHRYGFALRRPYPSVYTEGGRYGLTTFRKIDKDGLGSLCLPTALGVDDKEAINPCSRCIAFWLKPNSIFGLL